MARNDWKLMELLDKDRNSWKWLTLAENGWNGRKLQDIAVYGYTWLEMAKKNGTKGWKWQEMTGNG